MKEVRECPICDWKHEAERPQVPAGAPASVFGPGVMSAVAMQQHAWDIERALDAHFRTHSTVDWVKATVALRARVAELEYVAGLMWDRYEDGEPCYEGMTDDDTGTYTGQAVYFSDEETARILAAIPEERLPGNKEVVRK